MDELKWENDGYIYQTFSPFSCKAKPKTAQSGEKQIQL